MDEPHSFLSPFLARLHGPGRLRVWSIVVTIFGDLVQPRQMPISMQDLLSLTGHVGIEGNALRTAMSRLAKEGWVERQRDGRLSSYQLTASGRETFLAASERIYREHFFAVERDWIVTLYPDAAPAPASTAVRGLSLNRQAVVFSVEDQLDAADPEALIFHARPKQMPDWVRKCLVPDGLQHEYEDLLAALRPIAEASNQIQSLSPISAMSLRYLVIHFWRRLVLRHPAIPQGLLPDDWPGAQCHAILSSAYTKLAKQSEVWWQDPTPASGLAVIEERFQH